MNCKQCNAVIEQVGNRTKEFCSDRCRKAYSRQSGQSNPDKVQSGQNDGQSGHGPMLYGDDPINRQYKHGDTVTLSNGQTFVRDMSARDQLNEWARTNNGTRGMLGVLSGQYEVIR